MRRGAGAAGRGARGFRPGRRAGVRPRAFGGRGDSLGFPLCTQQLLTWPEVAPGEASRQEGGAGLPASSRAASASDVASPAAERLPGRRPLMGSDVCDSGASARWSITCPRATLAPDGEPALFAWVFPKGGRTSLSGFREDLNLDKGSG